MTSESIPFPDEVAHLEMTRRKLDAALGEANSGVARIDQEYKDAKRYMADYRAEIDPHEMFQNELALKQIDRTGAFAVSIWEKLEKLKASPYFARIDFQEEDSRIVETYYIGRFAFSHQNALLICDWRAPIAGMFYDCELGPAGYEAPVGKIEGNLTRKRQFKVQNGVLEYALESSVNIQDDVLQRELSHTSNEKMKSIISTIQKEQNQIIRNEKADTLIIQGVAGSGKTSIALHRIAFLLYRFQDKLSAQNVAILSPNKVFGDYISNVLPELGEEPIFEFGFDDIAEVQLQGVARFEPNQGHFETEDEKWAERMRFKSTLDFVTRMDRYLQEVPALIFEAADYRFGRFSVTADWIQDRFYAYQNDPIKKRLQSIATDIHDRFESDNFMGDEIPRVSAISKSLHAMLKIKNSLALYKHFYKWIERPDMLVFPAKQTLEWADVFPFLYLKAAFEGLRESRLIKHLVIDEMQDYTPIQYAVIDCLFCCSKTILGDFSQMTDPNHLHTLADMRQLYPKGSVIELTKSYRSTYEIIMFAKSIVQVDRLEPIKRHGEAPLLISCKDRLDELIQIKESLAAFLKSENASMGIILKTDQAAQALHKLLAENYAVRLISQGSDRFADGIFITSVRMSKGLEFDEVIIPDVCNDTYKTEYDKNLLYIAVTRAMHRLTLLNTGHSSRFLNK